MRRSLNNLLFLALCGLGATWGCADDEPACDADPMVMKTAAGLEYVHTPDACFVGLSDWTYAAKYVDIDGLRQAYVDEGPVDGPVVLLLHGQPSWSYLYRKMIPVLVEGGYRVIVMDHLGMGRSDKPIHITDYSYLVHIARLEAFINKLNLRKINLFCQDWGSLIGLHVAGLHPDWFARIAVGDGTLPVVPKGAVPAPPVKDPDIVDDTLVLPFAGILPQQTPFYEDDCKLTGTSTAGADVGGDSFGEWMAYAMKAKAFRASEILEALTWFDLPPAVEAGYDAPFPSRIYMAGVRVFPSLINELPGANDTAWAGLTSFKKPFLTLWADNDPGSLGRCETQNALVRNIPGAAGQPHDRLAEASHFLQEDQGAEIARRLVTFYASKPLRLGTPLTRGSRYCEILIAKQDGTTAKAEVWGTHGLNDCPAEKWDALDPNAIKSENGALAVVMNGPRLWLPNHTTGSGAVGDTKSFGQLEMHLLATVVVDPSQTERKPYVEVTVKRNTTYTFDAGEQVFELENSKGETYVMQAMSQIIDPKLTIGDLATLGDRLTLPAGWTFSARTLEAALVISADGEAVVVQDELQNTYQRAEPSGTATPPPVLSDGTGTTCSNSSACASFAAKHCLLVQGATVGFCTIEGCKAGACGSP